MMDGVASAVNRNLAISGRPKVLYDAAGHLIKHGGKRLRPFMVITSCRMLGGTQGAAMGAACAIEMIHNFTLVHDDIMDGDDVRHGVPTVHKRFGSSLAILAGDVLFSKAFVEACKGDPQVPAILARACVRVCEGQVEDITMASSGMMPTKKQYISMVSKKTAALFEASCALGAVCASAGQTDISNLSSFGRNLGIAFQITDDLIGVVGDAHKTKKPVGNDIREGKKSLPISMALERAGTSERKTIQRCLGNPRASKRDLAAAVTAMRSLGIEQDTRRQAARYANRAIRSVKKYQNVHRTRLEALLEFVIERSS